MPGKNDFEELATLASPDEVLVSPITFKTGPDGQRRFSFALLRNIAQANGMSRTSWLHPRHITALRVLIDQVERRLADEEEKSRLAVAKTKVKKT